MAGPSVAVRVLGDMSGMNKAFADATTKASTAGASISSGLKGALGALNSTGILSGLEGALGGVEQIIDRIGQKGGGLANKLMGGGAGVAALGAGFSALGSKDKIAHQQLQVAIENSGKSYDDYETQIDDAVKHQEKFGNTAHQTQDALRILTQAVKDPAIALKYMGTVSDLAAAKHEDLTTAAQQLGRAYNGSTKILKEFGLSAGPKAAAAAKKLELATTAVANADEAAEKAHQKLSDVQAVLGSKATLTAAEQIRLRDATQNAAEADARAEAAHGKLTAAQDAAAKSATSQGDTLDSIAGKLNGQASAAANSFTGKMREMRAKIADAAAELGQKYGPAVTAAGAAMTGLGATMKVASGVMSLFRGTQAGVAAAEGVAAGAATAEAAALDVEAASATAADAATLPIIVTVGLIVLAIAALILIAWLLYNNWDTIWSGIQSVTSGVFDWIADHWPMLLEILTGPIGAAVGVIVDHWNTILGGIQAVWNWIKGVWQDVYNDLVRPIERAVEWIGGVPDRVLGFFRNMLGDVGSVFTNIGSAISSAFKVAFNAVARFWNASVGSLSFSLPSWLPGIGGKGFSMPHIPQLAQGGLITATGIVFAHKGEVIAPVEKVLGRNGPVMHIEHATFNEPVDVDVLSRRLEFALSAGLPV